MRRWGAHARGPCHSRACVHPDWRPSCGVVCTCSADDTCTAVNHTSWPLRHHFKRIDTLLHDLAGNTARHWRSRRRGGVTRRALSSRGTGAASWGGAGLVAQQAGAAQAAGAARRGARGREADAGQAVPGDEGRGDDADAGAGPEPAQRPAAAVPGAPSLRLLLCLVVCVALPAVLQLGLPACITAVAIGIT